ncbi:hypothetical protein DQ393_21570 [Rhizobium tropici]|uniref:Uncharacterized protein n=1 Tax=Rhizobium tropici TaxID=398 RepID=A0A329Y880_RHITR|nr:hypothetical protein DQ393_21570 [Rhizobium tropici]
MRQKIAALFERNIRPDKELYDLEILIAGSTDMMTDLQVHLKLRQAFLHVGNGAGGTKAGKIKWQADRDTFGSAPLTFIISRNS